MLADHLEKLRAFYLTALEGSLLRASQKAGITQPAMTKAIKILEADLDATLFVRHARGVRLTPKGALLKEFCETLFLRVRDIEHRLGSNEGVSGIVRIGTHETLGEVLFPSVLQQVTSLYPGLVAEISTENIEGQWSQLAAGSMDILVGTAPRNPGNFYTRALYTDSFGVFCKKGSPFLHAKDRVPISYVKKAFDHLGMDIEQHLSRLHPNFDVRYAVESFTTVRALVAEGVCAGILPVQIVRTLVKAGTLVTFPDPRKHPFFGEYKVCATCIDDMRREPKIAKLFEILKSCGSDR